jgi:DNA invertase Pin-like site-specific DNA recombinase
MMYGYARVSSIQQDYAAQVEALKAAGCGEVFAEKFTGKTAVDRKQLQALLDKVVEGDVIVVTKLDRLGRSTRDLLEMEEDLERRGVGFKSLGDPMVDTTTPAGRFFRTVMSALAQMERELIRERCATGIARAKAEGRHLGRKHALNPHQRAEAKRLLAEGATQRSVARLLGVGVATINRLGA